MVRLQDLSATQLSLLYENQNMLHVTIFVNINDSKITSIEMFLQFHTNRLYFKFELAYPLYGDGEDMLAQIVLSHVKVLHHDLQVR